MSFKPTDSQLEAMTWQNTSVLVSAGAGSGKTRVLVERLIKRIENPKDPVNIDRFLIITYTRAAASELRSRIMEDLSKSISADPSNRHLRNQNALISRAAIGTIHSFCSGILRENCPAVNLTPDFKVIEEDRANTMKVAALERVLDAAYSEPEKHPGFLTLVDTISTGRDDTDLSELVLALYQKMQSHARPLVWARQQVEAMRSIPDDVAQSPWGQYIMEYALRRARSARARLQRLADILSDPSYDITDKKTVVPAFSKFTDSLNETISSLDDFEAALLRKGWDEAATASFISFPTARMPSEKKNPDLELSERAKAERISVKTSLEKLTALFFAPSAELAEAMRQAAPILEALVNLTEEFTNAYATDKRRASVVDYADLEHFAAELLTDENGNATDLAQDISNRFCEIMVDEYQDVSEVQNTIFRAISRNGENLFFVGDVKQSIYGFRLADPGIFTTVERTYEDNPSIGKVIRMQDNFRSRREIIECVNAIFGLCMSPLMGAVDYANGHSLNCGSTAEGSVELPEIILVQTDHSNVPEAIPVKESGTSPEASGASSAASPEADMLITKDEQEAMYVAEKILELTHPETGYYTYSDIAILMRSVNPRGILFADVLSRYGIPVIAGSGQEYFSCLEIAAVVALLSVTDNPHQDIPLTTVLLSPLFGFTPDELARIRTADTENDLFTALLHTADIAEAELTGKIHFFLSKLRRFRETAPDLELPELIRLFYTELDAPAIYSAMSDGRRRYENLMTFPQLADRFRTTGQSDLHRFVLWLERLAAGKTTITTGCSENSAVQIMTIHKSKGLEFPVVFLCCTSHHFNEADIGDRVLVHKDLGFGPFLVNRKKRLKYQTLSRAAISRKMTEELRSEEMRVLYVAMTRPKDRLFILAADTTNNLDKLQSAAEAAAADGSIDPEFLLDKKAYIYWLLSAAYADHEKHIRVKRYHAPQALPKEIAEAFRQAPSTIAEDLSLQETLLAQLSYRYPYQEATVLPSKITATELKGRDASEDDEATPLELLLTHPHKTVSSFSEPDFVKKKKPLTGAALGTATHTVLQHIRLDMISSNQLVTEELTRLQAEQFITVEEATAVSPETVVQLFASSIGQRILHADKLWRELKFSLLCNANELLRSSGNEEILLQGVMDCVLEENGEITIVDYKTDYVGSPEILAERNAYYTGQLRTYALAARRIFGKPVKECVLYYLRSSLEVAVKL